MPWNNQGNNSGGPWGNGSNSGGSGPWGGGNREPNKQNPPDFEKIISDFKSGFGSKFPKGGNSFKFFRMVWIGSPCVTVTI